MDPKLLLVWMICTIFAMNEHVSLASTLDYTLQADGSYTIVANGRTWLKSAPSYFTNNGKTYSTADGSLKLLWFSRSTGATKLGTYVADVLTYDAGGTRVVTSFVKYDDVPNAVFFSQEYYTAGVNTSVGDKNKILSAFPNFDVGSPVPLGYLAYGGLFFGDMRKYVGLFDKTSFRIISGTDGGPLVLFDNSSSALIISPATSFMAMSPYHDIVKGHYGWGIMGGVKEVPAKYIAASVLYFSDEGVQQAFEGWGDLLRFYYDKPTQYRDSDMTINYLSYWSDNGAYYVNYYVKPPYLIQNRTYEQDLLAVTDYAQKMKIPYRSIQYSVWFLQGMDTGIKQWDANPKLFPSGMRYMFEKTGLLGTAHNRWWSKDTTYAKQNGGPFDFIIEEISIPQDQAFWDYFFAHSKQLGFKTFMQDWLNKQFDDMEATTTTVDVARTWLLQMGRGALKNDMTIQYCMSLSRHILQSLELPAVTQGRASDDFQPKKEYQWQIGISSMFAHAVGMAPFKDTFWTTEYQPGNYYNETEPCPELNTVVSTLSTGPVGPGDMAGATNVSLLMRCCRSDGLILKPSRPAFATTDQLQRYAFTRAYAGELWTTHSFIGRDLYFGIIFAADLRTSFTVMPSTLGIREMREKQMIYSFTYDPKSVGPVKPFSYSSPLKLGTECSMKNFCLYYTSPLFIVNGQEVVLLGELDKFVPMSSQRVKDVLQTSSYMTVTLELAAGESLDFYYLMSGKLMSSKCFSKEGLNVYVDLATGTCQETYYN